MGEQLEELKRLAYENACCRCQYYIDKKCTNKGECIWLDIEKELEDKEKQESALKTISDIIRDFNKGEFANTECALQEITNILSEVLL